MATETTGKIPKPLMRGLLRKQIGRNLVGAFFVTVSAALIFQFTVKNGHRSKYDNFYKNYDIEKEFEIMRKKGVFDSCAPDDK